MTHQVVLRSLAFGGGGGGQALEAAYVSVLGRQATWKAGPLPAGTIVSCGLAGGKGKKWQTCVYNPQPAYLARNAGRFSRHVLLNFHGGSTLVSPQGRRSLECASTRATIKVPDSNPGSDWRAEEERLHTLSSCTNPERYTICTIYSFPASRSPPPHTARARRTEAQTAAISVHSPPCLRSQPERFFFFFLSFPSLPQPGGLWLHHLQFTRLCTFFM